MLHSKFMESLFNQLDDCDIFVIGGSIDELMYFSRKYSNDDRYLLDKFQINNNHVTYLSKVISQLVPEDFETNNVHKKKVMILSRVLEHLFTHDIIELASLLDNNIIDEIIFIVPDMTNTKNMLDKYSYLGKIRATYEIVNETQFSVESIMLDSHKWWTDSNTLKYMFPQLDHNSITETTIEGFKHLMFTITKNNNEVNSQYDNFFDVVTQVSTLKAWYNTLDEKLYTNLYLLAPFELPYFLYRLAVSGITKITTRIKPVNETEIDFHIIELDDGRKFVIRQYLTNDTLQFLLDMDNLWKVKQFNGNEVTLMLK